MVCDFIYTILPLYYPYTTPIPPIPPIPPLPPISPIPHTPYRPYLVVCALAYTTLAPRFYTLMHRPPYTTPYP